MKNKTFATLSWSAADVQTLAPKMTKAQAEEWLESNGGHLRDRLCELGWEVIGSLLSYDGIDTGDKD